MLAAGQQFELILTDMLNWPLDGFSLLLRIKEKFPHLPVVVASAVRDDDLVKACLRSGACEYLFMRFDREQLLATVGRTLNREMEDTEE